MLKSDVLKYYTNPDKAATTAIADVLGISVMAVYQWGEMVPEKQAARLDRFTNGRLKYKPEHYRK